MSLPALLLAIATAQATAPYLAHGTEPFWGARIGGGRIVYTSAEGARIAVRTPPRQAIRNDYNYVTPRFRIEVTHVQCGDGMGDRLYADSFRISFPGGGPPLDHERRVMAVLGGRAAMHYLDGDTLVLAGHCGTIRLRRQ